MTPLTGHGTNLRSSPPNIILMMSAGAEDVVDHVAGGAGGPLWQSVGLAVRPAGDGVDQLKST